MPSLFDYFLNGVANLLPERFGYGSRRLRRSSNASSTGSLAAIESQLDFEGRPNQKVLDFLIAIQAQIEKDIQAPSPLRRFALWYKKNNKSWFIVDNVPRENSVITQILDLENRKTRISLNNLVKEILADGDATAYLNQLIVKDARLNTLAISFFVPFGVFSVRDYGWQNKERVSVNLPLLTNNYHLPNSFANFLAVTSNGSNGFVYWATVREILEQWAKVGSDMQSIYNNVDWHFSQKLLRGFLRLLLEAVIFTLAFFSAGGDFVMSDGLQGWSYFLVIIFHFLGGISGMYGFKKPVDDFLNRDKNQALLTIKNIFKVLATLALTAFIFFAVYPSALLAANSKLGSWLAYLTVTIGLGNSLLFAYNAIFNGASYPDPRKDLFGFTIFLLTSLFFLFSGNNTFAAATMVLIEEEPFPTLQRVITFCLTTGIATGALNVISSAPEVASVQENIKTLRANEPLKRKLTLLYDGKLPLLTAGEDEETPLIRETTTNGDRKDYASPAPHPLADKSICVIM